MAAGVQLYGLSLEFERAFAVAASTRPALYGRVVSQVEPGAFADPTVALVIRAVQAIGKELKQGPSSVAVVSQRLHRWMDEGRVTYDELEAVGDLFLDTPLPPTSDELITEIRPILKRRLHRAAAIEATTALGRDADFESVSRLIEDARRIGTHDATTGFNAGGAGMAARMAAMAVSGELGTGIMELDMALGGGTPPKTVTLSIAPTGVGKTALIIQQAVEAWRQGHLVCYATMELPSAVIEARMMGNLLDMPWKPILYGQTTHLAEAEHAKIQHTLGQLRLQDFPGGGTMVADIRDWVRDVEQEEGRQVTVLGVDYLDELVSEKKEMALHEAQGTVMAGLVEFAKEHGLWIYTASGAKKRDTKERTRRTYPDDVSDSAKKARKADVVIGVSSPDPEGLTVEFLIGKNRYGQRDIPVGPFPHNHAHGQIVARIR